MVVNKNKKKQRDSLEEICKKQNVDFNSLETLLDSATTRMLQNNNRGYHQLKIDDVIKKAIR